MRRNRSPRRCTLFGSRSASAWAIVDFPAAMFPVIRMICGLVGIDGCIIYTTYAVSVFAFGRVVLSFMVCGFSALISEKPHTEDRHVPCCGRLSCLERG